MKYELRPFHHNTPSETLLADLRAAAAAHGQTTISAAQYDRTGSYCALTLIRRFGSWNEALKKAHLTISNHYNIPIHQLFANLQQLWQRLGRQPTWRDMQYPQSRYSLATYAHRFGTWRNALQQFIASRHKTKSRIPALRTTALPLPASRNNSLPFGEGRPARHSSGEGGGEASPHRTTRTINWRLRFTILQRDCFRCVACGRSPATDPGVELHVDHITPWTKGGETLLENLQTLCSVCNIGKSDTVQTKKAKKVKSKKAP